MQNYHFTPAQQQKALRWLVFFHILVIAASNYLVQFPFSVTLPNGFEVHSTWGALSFPFIFLATDLTVRIFGQSLARRIIFFRLRRLKSWWIAPPASPFAGNAVDTVLFFSIAFAGSSDAFMAANWPHIAFVDYLFKLVIGTLFFLPAYGLILNILTRKLTTLHQAVATEAVSAQPEAAGQSN